MPRNLKGPWLDSYIKYVADTEAPEIYKYWCGVLALSITLKRKVFVRRGKIQIYPNQYLVLVGPPGVGKGIAMNPAIDLVKSANTGHFIEDRATAERIQEIIANGWTTSTSNGQGLSMGVEHAGAGVAPELSIFLGASDWSLQFLCSLWDKNEFTYDTKKTKGVVAKEICFSLLGACTPDYIRKLNYKDAMAAVAGGFTSRTVFAFANKKGKSEAWPDDTANALKDDLVNDLRAISQLHGEMKWTQSARDIFQQFYIKNDASMDELESEVLVNFKARMWSHVVKLAMVLSVNESDDLVIHDRHISEAIKRVYEILKSLDITFRGVGESDLVDATDRVMKFIEKKGKCSRSEILRYNYRHITDEDLTRVLYTLVTIGYCTEADVGGKPHYTHNPNFDISNVKVKGATP